MRASRNPSRFFERRPGCYERKVIAGVIEARARCWRILAREGVKIKAPKDPSGYDTVWKGTKIQRTWGPTVYSVLPAFDKLLLTFETLNYLKKQMNDERVSASSGNWLGGEVPPRILKLQANLSKAEADFEKKYGEAMGYLWTPKSWSPDQLALTNLPAPFINVMLFPADSAGRKRLRRFNKCLQDVLWIQEGQRRGAPSSTRSLSPQEQKLAEKMRQKGKGTEKGSSRIIASRIAEGRDYSLSTEGRMLPSIAQNVKRHFRRKRSRS